MAGPLYQGRRAEALHAYFDRQRAAYVQARVDWRRDHPLVPGSTWTPESIGLPPREQGA